MAQSDRWRAATAFAILFVLYQAAEGIGGRLLGSFTVQAALMVAVVVAAWPLGRWLGFRGYDAYALEWRRSAGLSNTTVLATAEEVAQIEAQIEAVLAPYVRRKGEAAVPSDARPVRMLRYVLPEAPADATGADHRQRS